MSRRSKKWRPPHPGKGTIANPFAAPPPEDRCRWQGCKSERTEVGAETFGRFALCDYHVEATVAFFDLNEKRAIRQVEAEVPTPDDRLTPGVIYYALIDGTIKIGYTTDVYKRMRQYPPTARLLAVEPGTEKLERVRHSLFAIYLAHGREWFTPNPELDTWINQVIEHHGPPPFDHFPFNRPGDKKPIVASRNTSYGRAV